MRQPASFGSVLVADLTRCRMRPVLGRAPVLGAAGVAGLCLVLQASGVGVQRPGQVADVVSIGSTVAVIASVAIGAMVTHDARRSGMDGTDRSMVGRPSWIATAHVVAVAWWAALVVLAVGAAAGIALGAGAATQGRVHQPMAWVLGPLPSMGQAAAGAGLGAAVGAAGALLLRSPAATITVFLGQLMVGDALVAANAPAVGPALLPDNLVGLASGQLEGLVVRTQPWAAVAAAAVVGTTALGAAAVAVDARRDLGG